MTLSSEAIELISLLLRILDIVLVPAIGWLWWLGRKKTARITYLEKANTTHEKNHALLQKDMEQLDSVFEKEMERVDEALKAVPGSAAIHDLAIAIEGLRGEVKAMGEKMCGQDRLMEKIDAVVSRQEEHLLNKKG